MRSEKGQTIAGVLVMLMLLALAMIMVLALLGPAFEQSGASQSASNLAAQFTANSHALASHIEAPAIQECLNKKGPSQVWKDRMTGDFYALCEVEKGAWGLAVCTASGSNKTMFSPGNGSWTDVFKYVLARGTRFTKGLPAGCD